jgi:hypothetical protein
MHDHRSLKTALLLGLTGALVIGGQRLVEFRWLHQNDGTR